MDFVEVRICVKCGVAKKTNDNVRKSDFRKNGKKPDGAPYFRRKCKDCEAKQVTEEKKEVESFVMNHSEDPKIYKDQKNIEGLTTKFKNAQKE